MKIYRDQPARSLPRRLYRTIRKPATMRRRAAIRAAAYAAGIVLAMLATGYPTAGAYARGLSRVLIAAFHSRTAVDSAKRTPSHPHERSAW